MIEYHFNVYKQLYQRRGQQMRETTQNGIMSEETASFLRKREQFSVQIRKSNREQLFNEKRMKNSTSNQTVENMSQIEEINAGSTREQIMEFIIDEDLKEQIYQINIENYTPEMLIECIKKTFNDSDVLEMHRGVIGIRKIMTGMKQPPISKCIDLGMLQKFVSLMKQNKLPQLKLEAAWSLANLTIGDAHICKKIVEKGAAKVFIDLLRNPHVIIVEQAIYGIGNIAASNRSNRDYLIKQGAVKNLVYMAQNAINKRVIRNCCWALSNLCRGFPQPEFKLVSNSMPVLCMAIKNDVFENSNSILSDCCWAINYLTETKKEKIQFFLKQDCLPCFFRLAASEKSQVCIPALRVIGNVSTGVRSQSQVLIDHQIYDLAYSILSHPRKEMRKEICWILSNVAALQINTELLHRQDIIQKLLTNFEIEQAPIRKEICWIFVSMTYSSNTAAVMDIFLRYELIRYFIIVLDSKEHDILENIVDCFQRILDFGHKNQLQNSNIILESLVKYGGAEKLEKLQYHPSKKIYQKVAQICQKFSEPTSSANDITL